MEEKMSLQDVRQDYAQEQTVLRAWKNRMDIKEEVCEIPPEFAMSIHYKQGWKLYLDAVLSISTRMLAMCAKAAASNNTNDLKTALNKEADAYDQLATQAGQIAATQGVMLDELQTMLKHEATSRRDIVDSL
jgi:hypothetical protein